MGVYDGRPVIPAWEGTLVQADGARFTAGRDRDLATGVAAELLSRPEPVAVDTESCGKDGVAKYLLKVITFATPDGTALALDPRADWQRALAWFLLEHAGALVMHNSAWDVPILGALSLFRPEWCAKTWDTLVYARLAEPGPQRRKSLGDCGHRYLGLPAPGSKTRAARSQGNTLARFYADTDIDSPGYLAEALRDAVTTARLLEPVRAAAWRRIVDNPFHGHGGLTADDPHAAHLLDREQIVNRVFLRAGLRGLEGDPEYLDRYREVHDREIDTAAAALTAQGLRPGNGNDLAKRLLDLGALPHGYPWTKGGERTAPRPSTAKDELEKVPHPLVTAHLTYAELVHVRDDYLAKAGDALAVAGTVRALLPWSAMTDRIRPAANILGADATGRMSYSGDFPAHQIPGAARGVVTFDQPHSSVDWAQVEPVLLANVAGDVPMLEGYEQRGEKLYDAVADAAGVAYAEAKVIILAAMYGEGLASSARKLGIDYAEAQNLRARVFDPLPRSRRFLAALKRTGGELGRVVTTAGRVLDVPWYPAKDGMEAGYAGYKAQNYYVQGSAYDELAETVVRADREGYGDAITMAHHDELVVLTEAADHFVRIMADPSPRLRLWSGRTPVLRTDRADLGRRWAKV